jgi:TolB-like protein
MEFLDSETLSARLGRERLAFKGKSPDAAEVASKLHVQNVVTGSVRKSGNRVRVSVQLVGAADGFQLWSERYDRPMDHVFAIQNEIATAHVVHLASL